MQENSTIRLTQTVQKGGCAAKVAATELKKILHQVTFPPRPPELLIGSDTFDDAAIFLVQPDLALVQTLDFFTPIVDTPELFGKIAAANALSDVYAMGGIPKTAMAIFAFPLATLDTQVAVELLRGVASILTEAGAALVGGHTIDDDTIKLGLSVTGYVNPSQIWSNSGARVGDSLILTKPLGTGTLTAALKRGETTETGIQDALDSMCLLNNVPQILSGSKKPFVHAATDITGFGLAGHALNLARASRVSLSIETKAIPRFARAYEFLEKGMLTKAHRTNREFIHEATDWTVADSLSQLLCLDPQTSGGILLSVQAEEAAAILEELRINFPASQIIGKVIPSERAELRFQ